jgi:hypothetical protein
MKSLTSSLTNCAGRAGVAAAVFVALIAPVSPAQAGFFDFLFPPQPSPALAPGYPPGFRYEHRQHRRKIAARHPRIVVARSHPSSAHGVTGFMDDDSLRDGDAVMTPDGIRIFTGSSSAHHSADYFAKISEIKGLPSRERNALLAIDAGNSGGSGDSALLIGRSVADSGLSEGAMITDAKGHRIRYVGP